jgi:hypothetical protein
MGAGVDVASEKMGMETGDPSHHGGIGQGPCGGHGLVKNVNATLAMHRPIMTNNTMIQDFRVFFMRFLLT